jgi:hypothetical protein
MNLLENLNNISEAPCDDTKIVIVWFEELLDIPSFFIRVCSFSHGHYWYISDSDFAHKVPENKIIGWCHL